MWGERISSQLVFCGKCESIYVLLTTNSFWCRVFFTILFFFLFPSIKLEVNQSSSEESLKSSWAHMIKLMMVYRIIIKRARIWQLDPAKGTKIFALTFFRLLNWKCFSPLDRLKHWVWQSLKKSHIWQLQLLSSTEFYWELLRITKHCWELLRVIDFTEYHWVLLSFPEYYRESLSFTEYNYWYHWVLLSITEYLRVLQSITEVYWVLRSFYCCKMWGIK